MDKCRRDIEGIQGGDPTAQTLMTSLADPGWSPEKPQDFWYECTLTYDGEEYTFTEDVDVWQRYDDGHIDEDALFSYADAPFPANFDHDKMSFRCVIVKEGDEY